jgi:hypothetical protein
MVQYIPLSKIKPDFPVKMTQHIKNLRKLMWDCMHLLIVRKNRKDGNFIIVSGLDRFEYLRKHTNKKYAPCIVDESKASARVKSWIHRPWNRQLLQNVPLIKPERMMPASWSIIRVFLKQEPRFVQLSRSQKIKVLLLGVRYKKTAVLSMKAMVDDILSK